MKRKCIFLGLVLMLLFSCQKKENACSEHNNISNPHLYENLAIPTSFNNSSQSRASSYRWEITVGHAASGCSGCVNVAGQQLHIDCMGTGNACRATATMVLSAVANALYTAITVDANELTSEQMFQMPARSLYVGMNGDEEIWLNVPAQAVSRNSGFNEQFQFEGLFFSDTPAFENE
ncbi:MAG: hypothetical protein LBM67_03310 [Lentimicrobiaceae bacterium]|nr:hypothetical protein [Lentimicrobiaceae bacterium]